MQDPANPGGQAAAAAALFHLGSLYELKQRVRDAALPAVVALLKVVLSQTQGCS